MRRFALEALFLQLDGEILLHFEDLPVHELHPELNVEVSRGEIARAQLQMLHVLGVIVQVRQPPG